MAKENVWTLMYNDTPISFIISPGINFSSMGIVITIYIDHLSCISVYSWPWFG